MRYKTVKEEIKLREFKKANSNKNAGVMMSGEESRRYNEMMENTTAGQWRKLGKEIENLKAELSNALHPIVRKLCRWMKII